MNKELKLANYLFVCFLDNDILRSAI